MKGNIDMRRRLVRRFGDVPLLTAIVGACRACLLFGGSTCEPPGVESG